MPYADWQLALLRAGLEDYRAWRHRRHGNEGWSHVASDMLAEPEIEEALGLSQDFPANAFGEAMRRFCVKGSRLEPPRLEAVRTFLIKKGYRTAAEFEPPSEVPAAAYALQNYLQQDNAATAEGNSALAGAYRARYPLTENMAALSSLTLTQISGGLLSVTERRTFWRAEDAAQISPLADKPPPNLRARGRDQSNGFAVLHDGIMVMFLKKELPTETYAYAAITAGDSVMLDDQRYPIMCLMRLDNNYRIAAEGIGDLASELIDTAIAPNLIHFVGALRLQEDDTHGG